MACNNKNCGNCGWYAEFEGVCCNGNSEHRADFRSPEDTCTEWQGENDEK